jgi:tetratricopeptide (TPR) repeat protein
MTTLPDRSTPAGVAGRPRVRSTTLIAGLVAAVMACGGNDKHAARPGLGARGADGDPTVGWLGGEEAGDEVAKGTPGVSPALRPPGLDLTPEQQKQRVEQALRRGRAAMSGAAPDPSAAIEAAQTALQADETSVDAMVLLAHANLIKGFEDQAEDILDKALKRGGDRNKQANFVMGLLYDRTERPAKAQASYEAAVRLDPSYTSALMNLGVHYLKNKRWSEAVQVYERLSGELGYQSAAVWTNLGSAYRGRSSEFNATDVSRRNELLVKAEGAYKRALGVKQDYGNAYYDLGLLYLDADPFPEGQGDMDRLKRLQLAKLYFSQYRQKPGADQKLADDQVGVTQKLIDREELARKKAADRAAKKAAKDAAEQKKGGTSPSDGKPADPGSR